MQKDQGNCFIKKLSSQKLMAQKCIAMMDIIRDDCYNAILNIKNCLYIHEYT